MYGTTVYNHAIRMARAAEIHILRVSRSTVVDATLFGNSTPLNAFRPLMYYASKDK